jgi:hypothetical protein
MSDVPTIERDTHSSGSGKALNKAMILPQQLGFNGWNQAILKVPIKILSAPQASLLHRWLECCIMAFA